MTERVTLTVRARDDLNEIVEHVEEVAGPITGERVLLAFQSAFTLLGHQPRAGHRRDDLSDDPLVLFWPVYAWLIAYSVQTDLVDVLAIVHGSRKPRNIFESLSEPYPPAPDDDWGTISERLPVLSR